MVLATSWGSSTGPARRFARRWSGLVRQALRYSTAGIAGTLAYVGLYMLFDQWIPAVVGNAVAWLITTLATNTAQRRWAFDVRKGRTADAVIGLVTSAATLIITTIAVTLLRDADVSATVAALITINTAAGTARFLTVRWWFVHRRAVVTG